MKPINFIKKMRVVGNTAIITIPAEIVELLNLIQGDFLDMTVKPYRAKEIEETKEPIKKEMPGDVFQAIKQAFITATDEEILVESHKRSEDIRKLRNDRVFGGHADSTIITITTSDVKAVLARTNQELAESPHIYIDISNVINKLGFTDVKKTTKGNKRLIRYKDFLDFKESEGITDHPEEGKIISFKLLPPDKTP